MLPNTNQSNPAMLVLEFGLSALAFTAAFAWPRAAGRWFAKVERGCSNFARRKLMAVAAVGLSVIVLRLALLPLFGVPLPFVPDDFSFLLQADTFLHGRLTNPTPLMWTHFETVHVSMVPTYQSMYFPGQALVLAAGQRLLGMPWLGVLVTSALMCAAFTWMLQAWLPANWALLGGLISVLRLGVFSYWTNTYHSAGSLAALAGALVLGALPRLVRTGRLAYGIPIGLGFAILGLTRPYEGVLLGLPVLVVLARWIFKAKNRPRPVRLARAAVVPLAIVIAAMAFLAIYDQKAFGKATTLPYTLNRAQYAIAPYYIWQQQRPEPNYRYENLRQFYYGELKIFKHDHSPTGFWTYSLEKLGFLFLFFAGFTLLVPMLMVRRIFLDRRIRFLLVCVLVTAAGLAIGIFLLPHYLAPLACAFYALGLQMMRHLRFWKPEGKPVGVALVRFTVVGCLLLAVLRAFAGPLQIAQRDWSQGTWNLTWQGPQNYGTERASIEAQLSRIPGGSLVLVRYWPNHFPLDEWVYNQANIDDAKVVWAREMGPDDNEQLLRYYRGRKAWVVEPDAVPARLTPYPMGN